jgi:hypothetical protein
MEVLKADNGKETIAAVVARRLLHITGLAGQRHATGERS